jgi:hypothetical protein
MTFVKSQDTKTPVDRSKAEVERILRRYGATAFATSNDYHKGRVVVTFVVPDRPGPGAQPIPVKLPLEISRVYLRMFPRSPGDPTVDEIVRHGRQWEQAERVAWRNLVLWIDAALSSSAIGLQTITETFFAHTVVDVPGQRRMIEVVADAAEELAPGLRKLLSPDHT